VSAEVATGILVVNTFRQSAVECTGFSTASQNDTVSSLLACTSSLDTSLLCTCCVLDAISASLLNLCFIRGKFAQQVHSGDVLVLLVQASNGITKSFCDAVVSPVHATADCLTVFTNSEM
jgi:hypothetical protein